MARKRSPNGDIRTALVPVLERSIDRFSRLDAFDAASKRQSQLADVKAGRKVIVSWVLLDSALRSLGLDLNGRHGFTDSSTYVVHPNGSYDPV